MKKFFFALTPIIIIVISLFLDELSPLEQALYFLILFLLTCLSINVIVESLFEKIPSVKRKLDKIKPSLGILVGMILLSLFVGCFLFVFNSFSGTGLINSFITLVLMYVGLAILIFIVSCFIEGITKQKKASSLKVSILFIGISYIVMATFGIMQLVS